MNNGHSWVRTHKTVLALPALNTVKILQGTLHTYLKAEQVASGLSLTDWDLCWWPSANSVGWMGFSSRNGMNKVLCISGAVHAAHFPELTKSGSFTSACSSSMRTRKKAWSRGPERKLGHEDQKESLVTRTRKKAWSRGPERKLGHEDLKENLVTRTRKKVWWPFL